MVFTIRTPRAAVCTADPVAALEHFRKASDTGMRPVATGFGGRALVDQEMERYAAAVADVFRIGSKAHRDSLPD